MPPSVSPERDQDAHKTNLVRIPETKQKWEEYGNYCSVLSEDVASRNIVQELQISDTTNHDTHFHAVNLSTLSRMYGFQDFFSIPQHSFIYLFLRFLLLIKV